MMAHKPRKCRRKWARAGRGLADFSCSLVITGISHVGAAAYALMQRGFQCAAGCMRRMRRKSSKTAPHPSRAAHRTGEEEPKFQALSESPSVTFDDVAGLEDAKREIELRMILPIRFPKKAREHGIRQGGGLLLYGPPGTGKTMLAKAVATELDATFYHIRPSDIMSGQVGQAEKNILHLFTILRGERRAVLFIDEIESLVPSRKHNHSTIMQRVISQILGEVDGLQKSPDGHTLFLVAASNVPEMIDPAMLRPGRLDTKIYVGPPNAAARRKMLETLLGSRQTATDLNVDDLVTETDGLTGAEIKELVSKAADEAFISSITTNQYQQITNERIHRCLRGMATAGKMI